MKYIQVYALFLMLIFCTSCVGQSKPAPQKEKIKSETKDPYTSLESDEGKFHTKYEYTDANGKRLIIQNSFPRAELYTDPNGNKYGRAIFWTRIINETDNPLELKIDFSGDSYEFPGSMGSSVSRYFKIILRSDTMTRDKEDLYNYGLTDLDSFVVNSIDKPSSLERTIDPKKSSSFYVVRLSAILKSDLQSVKRDSNIHRDPEYGTTRAGFSLKEQDLFYTLNVKEIHCGKINLKNLMLKNRVLRSH